MRAAPREPGGTAGTAALYLSERVLTQGLNFVVIALVARSYGPESFGFLAYSLALTQFAQILLASGTEPVFVRVFVQQPDRRLQWLGSGASLIAVASVACAVVLTTLLALQGRAQGIDQAGISAACVLTLGLLPSGVLVFEQLLRSRTEALAILRVRATAGLAVGAIKVAAVLAHAPLVFVTAAFALEAWVVALLYLRLASRKGEGICRWSLRRGAVSALMRELGPSSASGVVNAAFFRINHVVIPAVAGFASLGQYALAMNLVSVLDNLVGVVASALYPRLSGHADREPAGLMTAIARLARAFAIAAYAFAIAALLLGPWLVPWLFGPAYAEAGLVLPVLALAAIPSWSVLARSLFLAATGRFAATGCAMAIGLVCVVPATLWLSPKYGAIGAAWAQCAGLFCAAFLASLVLPSLHPIGRVQVRALVLRT